MTRQVLKRKNQPDLVYNLHLGQSGAPTILFLSGYRSDRNGSKALAFDAWVQHTPYGYVRFDYSGHGESGGVFRHCVLSDWIADADDMLTHVVPDGPVILVGSSMGGWIALALALRHPARIMGLIGIAAAPDFTVEFEKHMTDDQRAAMARDGYVELGSSLGPDPYIITQGLLVDGEKNRVLSHVHDLKMPMVLFQGGEDSAVPRDTPERIAASFPHADIGIVHIDDGDHGLSRPQDLDKIFGAVLNLCST